MKTSLKASLVSVLILSVFLGLLVSPVHAKGLVNIESIPTEQIINGDFETGTLLPDWTDLGSPYPTINSVEHHAGSYSMKIPATGTPRQDDLSVNVDQVSSFTLWVKKTIFNAYDLHLDWYAYWDGGGADYGSVTITLNNTWTSVDLTTALATGSAGKTIWMVEFYAYGTNLGGNCLYLDDVSMIISVMTYTNLTWYCRGETHTVHEELGYQLQPYIGHGVGFSDHREQTGSSSVNYGIRIYAVDYSGSQTELTSGSPDAVVTLTTNLYTQKTGLWTCPSYSAVIDAMIVDVYQRFGSGTWTLIRRFISDSGLEIVLDAGVWTFDYYLERDYNVGSNLTNSNFYWANELYRSGIGLIHHGLNIFETAFYRLTVKHDFAMAFLTPWTFYLGDVAYGFALLFVVVTLRNRLENDRAILALLWLFGGAGGFFNLMLPVAAINFAWIVLAVALAGTLLKLFT